MQKSPLNDAYDEDARHLEAGCEITYPAYRWRVFTTRDMLHSPGLRAMAGPDLGVMILELRMSRDGREWACRQRVSRHLLYELRGHELKAMLESVVDRAERGIASGASQ